MSPSRSNLLIHRGSFMILGFLLLLYSNSKGMMHPAAIDTIINTKLNALDPTINYSIYKNRLYYSTSALFDRQKRLIRIKQLNLQLNQSQSELQVAIPEEIKLESSPVFAITDDFLVIQDDYNLDLYLFKKVNNAYQFRNKIIKPVKTSFFEISAVNENLFLFTDCYNHNPKENKHNCSLAIYNATTNNFENVIHPEVPCIAYSHFPHNWICHNSTNIFLAEPCGRKIHLYDLHLKNEKIIEFTAAENWTEITESQFGFETKLDKINPKLLIDKMKPMIDRFNRIESLSIVNDSLLFISCNSGDTINTENKFGCMYNINTNRFWTKIITYSTTPSNTEPLTVLKLLSIIHTCVWFNFGTSVHIESDSFQPDRNKTEEKNKSDKEKFYETNEPEFIIRIRTLPIDCISNEDLWN